MEGFSDKDIETLLKRIHDGDLTESEISKPISEKYYYAIADYLKKGLYSGFGGVPGDFKENSKDWELLNELRENIYMFSAAKTYQQVRDMTDQLVDSDGNITSWHEFKEAAGKIFDQYNENWLRSEYDTAIGQGQNAVKWQRIEEQKDLFPMLQYSAVEDEQTCEICAPLDGMVAAVDDPIWDTVMPENHFRCRCLVIQLEDGKPTPGREEIVSDVEDKMSPVFMMNPGKDEVIFNEHHPYFDVAPKDSKLATNNFDLPIPSSDVSKESELIKKTSPLSDEEQAVADYTGSWAYPKIEAYLRKGAVDEDYADHIKDLVKKIDSYLDDAPKHDGIVYRGLQFEKKDKGYKELVKAIKEKGEIMDKGFMSTTADRDIVSVFTEKPIETILFEIDGKNGVSINHLARDPGEKEVLFKRNTKFKVISYEEKDYGFKVLKVKLKEL